ncbi:hypothetical protein PS627_01147 [Pseudomonas fluorescens]|jgi:hypothetical protein|uniref:DUF3077 domain-containing protein n=1 Tax=Pseudomonas fluorescens TaxID=294 RepID=UPI0012539124|nr:DUF3077 domain-containing protein [Pseudomonas fluorescens]MDF2490052.1 hypothetical protein [Pseudomonas sp.]CAG8864670.1 hypothetical protein PS627_01147 [Pseudomonas fluorescens]VVP72301.1 hypothetical protein PS910_01053 [Pseudomonas fluorescens]
MTNAAITCTTVGETNFLELFCIQPGIPFDRAFEELSVLLGCIRHLTFEAEMEKDAIAISSAHYLSAFAKALINDMELARQRSR